MGLCHRFDGYEELKPLLDGTDEEVIVGLAGKPALIRIPAASTARAPRARLVSCLLHGNEPSGFVAMVDVLRRGDRFPFDLWVLIGNVRAATENGLYAHRHLDDQEDINRIWGVRWATTDMRRCAAAILEQLRSTDLPSTSARDESRHRQDRGWSAWCGCAERAPGAGRRSIPELRWSRALAMVSNATGPRRLTRQICLMVRSGRALSVCS